MSQLLVKLITSFIIFRHILHVLYDPIWNCRIKM